MAGTSLRIRPALLSFSVRGGFICFAPQLHHIFDIFAISSVTELPSDVDLFIGHLSGAQCLLIWYDGRDSGMAGSRWHM